MAASTLIHGCGVVLAHVTIEEIDRAIPWVNRDGAPRDECFMSTRTDSYTYGSGRGVRTYSPIPYTALVESIRQTMKSILGIDYEACFSNKYVDERKHLGWHSDDSPSIDHSAGIAIVSFGSERFIWFRENNSENVAEKVLLKHGSVLLMPAGFQQTHQHRIPKHSAKCDTRISLTFRKLL